MKTVTARSLLALGGLLASVSAASVGLTVYDDLKCSKGAKETPLETSPYCAKGDSAGSVQFIATGAGDFVLVTGFASKDCSLPEGNAIGTAASFYNMGLIPADICIPFDAAFAIVLGKKSYKVTILSDGAIFGVFIACCVLALLFYVLSMHVRKVGPYAPDSSWADYLLNLKAASLAAADAAQKATAAAAAAGAAKASSFKTTTTLTPVVAVNNLATSTGLLTVRVPEDDFPVTTLTIAGGGSMGITVLRPSSAGERKVFGCAVTARALVPTGNLAKLNMRVPCGIMAINGASLRDKSREDVIAACKVAATSGADIELQVVYPPAGYVPEKDDDE